MRCVTREGFTLFEVLVVVVLLGMLAAFTWPEFARSYESEQIDESARRMRSLIQMCRARAMNESRCYRIAFRQDGTLELTRQRDPILAPHEYCRFREPWARMAFLLERVWVESVLPLPEGPPPLLVEDDVIEFEEFDERQIPVIELEREFELDFEPDGTCGSARWVLRDEDGCGVELTLDGRLGRVQIEPIERRRPEEIERPEPLASDEDEPYEEELEPLEERR